MENGSRPLFICLRIKKLLLSQRYYIKVLVFLFLCREAAEMK